MNMLRSNFSLCNEQYFLRTYREIGIVFGAPLINTTAPENEITKNKKKTRYNIKVIRKKSPYVKISQRRFSVAFNCDVAQASVGYFQPPPLSHPSWEKEKGLLFGRRIYLKWFCSSRTVRALVCPLETRCHSIVIIIGRRSHYSPLHE